MLLGRYQLVEQLRKGGLGRVYLATRAPMNRPVAVRIFGSELQEHDSHFAHHFHAEAGGAARLSHPNTIKVYDYGDSGAVPGEFFIAMEFVEGRSLADALVAEGPFSQKRILHIVGYIGRALREAHGKAVTHRGLRPSNVLLSVKRGDSDFAKVGDYGLIDLSKPHGSLMDVNGEAGALERAGMVPEHFRYMSPEQFQGADVDARTDLYSLGVLMYEMASGAPPFTGAEGGDIASQQVHDVPPGLAERGVDVRPEFASLVERCLAKQPDDRFPAMSDFLARLKEVEDALSAASSE